MSLRLTGLRRDPSVVSLLQPALFMKPVAKPTEGAWAQGLPPGGGRRRIGIRQVRRAAANAVSKWLEPVAVGNS
jgi:hypothetical protein